MASILDPATPKASRVPLLELLAETFERDVAIRDNCDAARRSFEAWIEAIKRLLRG